MITKPHIYRTDLSSESSPEQQRLDKSHTQTLCWVCMAGAVSQSNPGACAKGGGQ
jgi:hypothetical protein